MVQMKEIVSVTTVGDLIDHGYKLRVVCGTDRCHEDKPVDLQKIVERFGGHHRAMQSDLARLPWRCQRCGGRKVSFRISPGGTQYPNVDPDPDELPTPAYSNISAI